MAGQRKVRFGISRRGADRAQLRSPCPRSRFPTSSLPRSLRSDTDAGAREFAETNGVARVVPTYDDAHRRSRYRRHLQSAAQFPPLAEWSIRALRAGKHVLCEKPIAANADEAAQMAQVADETSLLLGEAFHYRYHPLADRIRTVIGGGVNRQTEYHAFRRAFLGPDSAGQYPLRLDSGGRRDDGPRVLSAAHDSLLLPGTCYRAYESSARRRKSVRPTSSKVSRWKPELELAPGVTARMTCSMMADAPLGASFIARGDHGELTVNNPVGPHWWASTHDDATPKTGTSNETAAQAIRATPISCAPSYAAMRGDRSAFPDRRA